MPIYLVLILCFFDFPVLGNVSEKAFQEISDSVQWHRLLHYKRSLPYFKLSSEVDGEGFFFSPQGSTDPLAEAKASWAAFSSKKLRVGKFNLHPQCAFPARFAFLQKAMPEKLPKVECPKVDEMMKVADPDSVTLVFSSAYPNNPASMFGHTFLRINRKIPIGQKKQDILDYGVSFAAAVGPDENPLAFIAFGLTGGYRGQFSYVPYYVKVNEYNNAESRDVWEYDLSLSPEESRFLLAHVWEIETNSYFDYYFFDENCSYQMLTLIEAAKPEWNISDFSISTIPTETLKRIIRIPGAVREVHYRPSLRQKMVNKVNQLEQDQKKALKLLLDEREKPENITDPFVLDAAVASLFYEKNESERDWEERKKSLQASLLVQRSKLGKLPEQKRTNSDVLVTSRPDLGHFAYRISLSPGWVSLPGFQGLFQEVGWKSAYHDLLNKDLGFLPFSQIDFPQIYFRYFPDQQRMVLENLELLHITSLFPLSFIEARPSWKLQVAYANSHELSCLNCKSVFIRGGLGFSVNVLSESSVFYGLLLAHLEAGSFLTRTYRLGPEVELALVTHPWENFKTQLLGSVTWDVNRNQRSNLWYHLHWESALSLGQSWELRGSLGNWFYEFNRLSEGYREAKLSLNYYF